MRQHDDWIRRYAWLMVLSSVLAGGIQGQESRSAKAAPAKFNSLAELQAFYNDKIEESRRSIEKERLAALEQLLKTAPAGDRRDVLRTIMESATALEDFERVVSLSDAFLKDYPSDAEIWTVRNLRFNALIETNQLEKARKEWEKLTDKVDMKAWQQVLEAGMAVAEGYLDTGQVSEVKAIYATMKKQFAFVNNLDDVLGPRKEGLDWVGKAAPALESKDLTGQEIKLADYRGKLLLIDFWATWCQPCLIAMPELVDTYRKYHAAGFEIVGISLDNDKEVLRRFLEHRPLPWRVSCDGRSWTGADARKFGISAIPATFLVDRNGKVLRVGAPQRGFGPMLRRLVGEAATSKPAKP